ncbi:hypothetical protein DXT91_18255 [Agrobacterium tumefaciens]|uniref:CDP-glycerol glycerophosphotransferase family protein n=1 Tax=Agrobacterium tumefaciens TaxID=358 RepID=UPI0012BA1652|nr:CDP-glycerol glycerophosphotransferase family protein [Agrobacterium tumefaciens]MQB06046.1 hypothetical protein [Agrobacterium tumefaciens]
MTKAGFIVRNKFQIRHFDALASTFPSADYLLYKRKGLELEFSADELKSSQLPVKFINRSNVVNVTSSYDVLFFQTAFPGIELIDQTPLVSVQYGLAKERHNYGEWRALADLNLMYGPYSASAVSHYGPSVAIGNLKFCGWDYRLTPLQKEEAKRRLGLDHQIPVVLYMPTYGELGSFDELVEPLAKLSDRYQILIKGHHNDEISGFQWMSKARALGHTHLFPGGFDQVRLLEVSDAVISDFSGAAFDAVYAQIPVILFQGGAEKKIGIQKFDLSSLEYRERERIGRVCYDINSLEYALEEVLSAPEKFLNAVASLRDSLFEDVSSPSSALLARNVVERLLAGDFPPRSKPQVYIRETIQRLLQVERELKLQSNKPIWQLLMMITTSISKFGSRLPSWIRSMSLFP